MENQSTSQPASGDKTCLATATLAVLLWSTSFAATKIAYESFPPLTLGACRFLLASLALGVAVLFQRRLVRPGLRDSLLLALSGFLGITLYFGLENVGVSLTSASNASLIVASYPAITVLLEWMIYGARISFTKGAGIFLAALGVYCIAALGGSGGETGSNLLLGNMLLIATGVVWALYSFVVRSLVNKYPQMTVSLYQTVAGCIAFIPLAFLEKDHWRIPTPQSWATLGYLGLLCSVAAFMLYNYGLRKLSAGTIITLMNLVPVFGVAFSVMLLGESITTYQLLGGIIVIAGVTMTVRAKR